VRRSVQIYFVLFATATENFITLEIIRIYTRLRNKARVSSADIATEVFLLLKQFVICLQMLRFTYFASFAVS